MYEMAEFFSRKPAAYPTCVQKINNPGTAWHGQFFFVGSVPAACYDHARNNGRGGSIIYKTEQDAIDAAIKAGATRIQKSDCSFVIGH
jgi:hypothetical protein